MNRPLCRPGSSHHNAPQAEGGKLRWGKAAVIMAVFLAIAFSSQSTPEALGQIAAVSTQNNSLPVGRRLDSAMVRDEIERRLAAAPRNEAEIWNAGYDFFRNYPRNQDTAKAIQEGFLRARPNSPEQKALLSKAAAYWGQTHNLGVTNVAAGRETNERVRAFYPRRGPSKPPPPGMRASGSRHKGFKNYERPGYRLNQKPPLAGRAPNPYPGKYYPGLYPPTRQ